LLSIAFATMMFLLLFLQLMQVFVESIETFLPELSVVLHPVGDLAQRAGVELAGTPLRVAAARDEPGPLEDLEVLGDRGEAHVKRLRELRHRRLALHQALENGAPCRIGERGEGQAERVHCNRPPSQAHGIDTATSTSGYHIGPSSGLLTIVTAAPMALMITPTPPRMSAWCIGRFGARRAVSQQPPMEMTMRYAVASAKSALLIG